MSRCDLVARAVHSWAKHEAQKSQSLRALEATGDLSSVRLSTNLHPCLAISLHSILEMRVHLQPSVGFLCGGQGIHAQQLACSDALTNVFWR